MPGRLQVTFAVHPSNVERAKELARGLGKDFASATQETWSAVLEVTKGDEVSVRQMLESRLKSGKRLIDDALAGPEGDPIFLGLG